MRRFISIWLPHWPTDRRQRQAKKRNAVVRTPLALTSESQGGLRLSAVDRNAAAAGLVPGMPLADARVLVPDLAATHADPAADAAALARLADWAMRYTPWSATDGNDGLLLDITGCAHLFGGEHGLLNDLATRLAAHGLTAHLSMADTPAAAWAWARYGDGGILAARKGAKALMALPAAALRIPAADAMDLARLGLRRIDQLNAMPRASLATRFGESLLIRLDQMFGRTAEPLILRRPPEPYRSRTAFAEPIGQREDIDETLNRLLIDLCRKLEAARLGARKLVLAAYGVDGGAQHISIGTAAAARDPGHFARLFREHLDRIDPGFGLESLTLDAATVEDLTPKQQPLAGKCNASTTLAQLVDRLQTRLGAGAVAEMKPVDSHIPERAVVLAPALTHIGKHGGSDDWMAQQPRPVRLLPCPEPIDVVAPVPDDPPLVFRWRKVSHRVARSEGPERIASEWWHRGENQRTRDYYWLEDTNGRRFWVYRDGPFNADAAPRWYLHGLFA